MNGYSIPHGAHVHANGIRQHYLHFRPASDAPAHDPVILVPGITSPAITWGFVAERLGSVLEVYVLDVRGRGLSQGGAGLDFSLDALADDVKAFAQAVGLQRYSILGHSMGARIAIRAGAARPPGLARLVLVDPPVSGPGRRPYPMQLSWYIDSIRAACKGMDAKAMRPYCPTWTEEHLRLRAEWLHTCDEQAVTASFLGFGTDDIHADLPRLGVPCLLVTAGRGDVVRPEEVAEIRNLVPHLLHAQVPDAGHMIPWDDEEGFYAALSDFLGPAIPTH